jgi:MFS family permease
MCSTISAVWKKLHQPRVYLTVEPVLFLYSFGSFLSYTVFQELLHYLACQRTPNCFLGEEESSSCGVPSATEQRVQTLASHWLLYVNLASGIPSVLVSVFYGAVSDVRGRRLFMVLPALGSILNQIVVLLVIYFQPTFPLPFFLLGGLLSGLGGSFPVFNFAAFSYVSDVSADSKRTVQISILESTIYFGATLSFLVGGRWVDNIYFSSPLYCIMALDLFIVVYVIVALPDSLEMVSARQRPVGSRSSVQDSYSSLDSSLRQQSPRQQYPRRPAHSLLSSPCDLLRSSFGKLLSFTRLLCGSWKLTLLLGMFFVVEINFLGVNDTVVLFALGDPLCWGTGLIGYFLAAKVFMNGVATLLLLPLLSLVGLGDMVLVVVGLVAGGAALLIMGLATHTWMMFIVPVVGAMRGCVVPIIRSMLSKSTPVDMQGVLFSGVSVVEAVCTLLASVIYNSLYPATRSVSPGLVFFLMAGALLVPLSLTLILELNRRGVCRSTGSGRSEEEDPLLGSLSSR